MYTASVFLHLILLPGFFLSTDAIQCYSCRATAGNEIEANINCLETANLEDCNDFYEYYSEVESGKDGAIEDYDVQLVPDRKLSTLPNPSTAVTRSKRQASAGRTSTTSSSKKKDAGKSTEPTTDYEYKGIDEDYNYNGDNVGHTSRNGSSSGRKGSLPTDPEHYCYSTTKKNAWESYTVEKGCKKISYCRAHEETMPAEWSLAWNFCCDKSRCNAKLVKDKPQRIFAMGCRRTDDCIQGHNIRLVCPEMFNTCPKVSTNVIKMECRVRQRNAQQTPPGGRLANIVGNAYFNQFKEKKCFCAKGFYPRGPICSGGVKPYDLSRSALSFLVCLSVIFSKVIGHTRIV